MYTLPLTPKIVQALSRIDAFRGEWRGGIGLDGPALGRLQDASRIQAIGAGCRLSGVRLSNFEVASLLEDRALPVRGADELRGYADAREQELPGYEQLLEVETLQRVHGTLAQSAEPTPLREVAGHREAFNADGQATGRVYSSLPPRMLQEKTEGLLNWLELECRAEEQHPLLVQATFCLGFLLACPFERFNGRMSRLLMHLLALRSRYEMFRFASIEREWEQQREAMDEAFDHSATHFWNGQADLAPWLTAVTSIQLAVVERLEARREVEQDLMHFSPLQRSILEFVQDHGSADAGMLLQITGANRNTLKDNLRKLVDRGLLRKTGETKGTRYLLSAPQ